MYDALGLRVRGFARLELSKPRNFFNPIGIQDVQRFGFMCLGLGFSCRHPGLLGSSGQDTSPSKRSLEESFFFSLLLLVLSITSLRGAQELQYCSSCISFVSSPIKIRKY